jgi:predicted metal-binding protein
MPKGKEGPSRLISLDIPQETLTQDLKNFREKALHWGASMAEIIPANWVEIDERVRLKCSIPLCTHYNKNIFCPPHAPPLDQIRKAFARYSRAILFALDVIPVEHFSGGTEERKGGGDWSKKGFEIVGRIETLAFGSGYYLAMGFGQASCKKVLCSQNKCLPLDGGKCPYQLKARPSMEGMGIDVFGLVTKVGWDIYPVYRSVNPKEVPRALSVGIVFIY